VHVDVFHDTVCPWCRVGRANLAAALARWEGPVPAVRYHPFLLDPVAPPEGRDFRAHLASRYGGPDALPRLFEGPRRAGAAVGLRFDFERITRGPNSLLSHVLIDLAGDAGRQDEVVEAVYTAFFEDARDIGEVETLVQLGASAGLAEADVRRALADPVRVESVREAAADARDGGITGVPLYVFGERTALSGAHPPEAMLRALAEAAANPAA
jgi:predicted DsbA family dithiol-disulfide isomerase